MPDTFEKIERELNLKKLQVKRLLSITQAINNNVSSSGLYQMYSAFLSLEMSIKKMALYFNENDKWKCKASLDIPPILLNIDISDEVSQFSKVANLDHYDHPLISQFDLVIPVIHKKEPVAYVFIGGLGLDEEEDMFDKVQLITTITNIVAVAIENKRLFKRQLEQERLKREMELASEMQKMLIPAELPCSPRYEFASIYKPHLGVGGDYFDVIRFDETHFAFCIADISGKGVAAALLMANFQANFHSLIRKRYPLDAFIKELNQSVLRITNSEKFITFFVAEYNTETRELTYINAGHNPPILVHNKEIILLRKGCTILGSFAELPHIEIGQGFIQGEAILLSYTDGLTDVTNKDGDFLDEQILHDFILQHSHLPVEVFNELLLKEIEVFKVKNKKGKNIYNDKIIIIWLLPAIAFITSLVGSDYDLAFLTSFKFFKIFILSLVEVLTIWGLFRLILNFLDEYNPINKTNSKKRFLLQLLLCLVVYFVFRFLFVYIEVNLLNRTFSKRMYLNSDLPTEITSAIL